MGASYMDEATSLLLPSLSAWHPPCRSLSVSFSSEWLVSAVTLPLSHLFLPHALSFSSSFFLASLVVIFSIFLPLSSMTSPFAIWATNSHWWACLELWDQSRLKDLGPIMFFVKRCPLRQLKRVTDCNEGSVQTLVNDRFLWQSLVLSCSAQHALQDGSLYSRQNYPDHWHAFSCKNDKVC